VGFCLEFDAINQILLIVFDGEITDGMVIECSERLRAAKFSAPICLIDFQNVTNSKLSTELIKWLAHRLPPEGSSPSTQVTIAPQDLIFGLSRMWGSLGEETWPNTYVARTMEEALVFVGVKSPSFSPLQLDLPRTGSDC
jgi:hypothetical protein